MKRPLALLVALMLAAPASAQDESLQQSLDASLLAFNRGDVAGYLHDVMPRVSYNEVTLERTRILAINQELQQTFPQLSLAYRKVHLNQRSQDVATASLQTEFKGSAPNYNGSGMPASYREEGQATALYQRVDGHWYTNQMQVAWDDSYVDIGQEFGVIGVSALPIVAEPSQPYALRLYTGSDDNPGTAVSYAYALAPLSTIMSAAGARHTYGGLKFHLLPITGLETELKAPKRPGTYVQVLVLNKFIHVGPSETLLGQKVYSRLLRVEQ